MTDTRSSPGIESAKLPEFGSHAYQCDVVSGGLELLLAAVHADDPKREILVRIGDLMRDMDSVRGAAQPQRPRAFLTWAVEMFGPVAKLRSERLLRFVEEAIELAHAEGMERSTFNLVADRVYSRPAGDTPKEIGQTQACLETFAENIGLSSEIEAEREWQRVQSIPQEEWTRRHTAKQALGIALPSTNRNTP